MFCWRKRIEYLFHITPYAALLDLIIRTRKNIFFLKTGFTRLEQEKQKGRMYFLAFVLNAESDIDQEEVIVSISKELYIGGGVWMKRGNQKRGIGAGSERVFHRSVRVLLLVC